jgi:outer membrane receptor protein involved in Fe transport
MAYGAQSDAAYHLNEDNIIRGGLFVQTDHAVSNTSSAVLLTDDFGVPLSDIPTTLIDNGSKTEWIYSAYLQDEWKIIPTVTINYGLRFDRFTAYTSDNQTSPRVNVVWQALPNTTVHSGYSRYMSPPPFELVGGKDIALFTNTTNPPLTPLATSPLAEKANYYDLGVQQKITPEFTVGLDSYYKQSANLIDEGQFGAPIILTPFNYRYGKQYGGEFTANYTKQDFAAYLNFAAQSAKGKDIESAQFNFAPEDLAYIANNYIHLDHEQQKTASGGVSYLWRDTRFSADFLVGSGLRASLPLPAGETTPYGGTSIPNGTSLPYYTQVNTGITHIFAIPGAGTLTARFDVINILDKEYQIRNGTGVGVGAPQYGPRRGFFFGLSKSLPAL